MNKDCNASDSPKVYTEIREVPARLKNMPDPVQNENVGFSPGQWSWPPLSLGLPMFGGQGFLCSETYLGPGSGWARAPFLSPYQHTRSCQPRTGQGCNLLGHLAYSHPCLAPTGRRGQKGGYSLRKPGLRVTVVSRWKPGGKDCPGPGCQWAESRWSWISSAGRVGARGRPAGELRLQAPLPHWTSLTKYRPVIIKE